MGQGRRSRPAPAFWAFCERGRARNGRIRAPRRDLSRSRIRFVRRGALEQAADRGPTPLGDPRPRERTVPARATGRPWLQAGLRTFRLCARVIGFDLLERSNGPIVERTSLTRRGDDRRLSCRRWPADHAVLLWAAEYLNPISDNGSITAFLYFAVILDLLFVCRRFEESI